MCCLLGSRYCCLLGGRCCLLRGRYCLLGNRCSMLRGRCWPLGRRCCLLGDLTLLCLLLRYLVPGLVCISPTLCLLCISPTLCLLCISPTLCLPCISPMLCLMRTLTNRSLIRLNTPLSWLGRLARLNIVCSSSLTTRVSS